MVWSLPALSPSLKYLINAKYVIRSYLFCENAHGLSPILLSKSGVNLDRTTFNKISYVVDNSDMPIICLITLCMNRHNEWHIPLMGQFFIIPNRINKPVYLRMYYYTSSNQFSTFLNTKPICPSFCTKYHGSSYIWWVQI